MALPLALLQGLLPLDRGKLHRDIVAGITAAPHSIPEVVAPVVTGLLPLPVIFALSGLAPP